VQETEANYAAAIYGSILVAALISSLDEEHATAGAMVLAVGSTMVVFWLAHVWADAMAARIERSAPLSFARLRKMARRQWPMLQSAAIPLALLALAAAGAWSVTAGVDLALAASVAQLAAWGAFIGLRTSSTWLGALLAGSVDAAFGLVIVVLKTLVH
jgi:hypothetical protein